jgi:CHASE3 domain sensor protein
MKKYASTLSVIIILCVVYWSFSDLIPSYNKNKTVSETEFSIDNALTHLKEISKTQHFTGSENHIVV